jgi:signal transduction histidine kinase
MSAVADYLRSHAQQITNEWSSAVVEDLRQLAPLERGTLIDHLPEVINGLAAWVEGRTEEAERSFAALADGHALQRLGFGIDLAALVIEYAWVRRIVLRGMIAGVPNAERADLVAFNEGLDRAIQVSVKRYTARRDFIRDRFVSILGHDLRMPLSAAATATSLLAQSSSLLDADRQPVETLVRSTERMRRLIGDVLDFAQGHLGGGIPLSPAVCDLAAICRAAAQELERARPACSVEVSTAGDLSGTFDCDRLFQAISNLLGNAFQHGEPPVRVRAWEAEDRRNVFVRVTNRGKPIAREDLDTIFHAFSHRAGPGGSMGLGLYVVDQIARGHGGTCEVRSEGGETAFTMRLPRTPLGEVPDRT